MAADPTHTDPDKYRAIFENERVRVLEYRDTPGARTHPHSHRDSVVFTLSTSQRRIHFDDETRDVDMEAGNAFWLPAQTHVGENIGTTNTHVLFVEFKVEDSLPPVDQ